MASVATAVRETSPGVLARRLRRAQHLTREELAGLAGVSWESVDLFERGLPVALDIRRRLLKVLWARKAV